jgi:undecaprenyl-diphosphatase
MDWSIFQWLNGLFRGHPFIQDEIADFTTKWAVPVVLVAVIGLWFLDRPDRPPRWRLAALSGVTAAGLGLLLAQPIGWVWFRERPFAAHPADTILLVPPSNEPSFPSDHAVAAFAIAFAVAFAGRRMGALFLAGATMIALARVVVGLHYPGDVAAGALLGLVSAVIVVKIARRPLLAIVSAASRATDPVARPLWQAYHRQLARRRSARR